MDYFMRKKKLNEICRRIDEIIEGRKGTCKREIEVLEGFMSN